MANKRFAGIFTSRSRRLSDNNLGIIPGESKSRVKKFRNEDLDLYDAYYESRQYDSLTPWDQTETADGEHIPVRKRKPRIVYNFAKVLVDRVAAKLVGLDVFPQLTVEDDPDTAQFLQTVQKVSRLRSKLVDPVKSMLLAGSGLVRFYFVGGVVRIEGYKGKVCYPEFQDSGELKSVRIQYTYMDPIERDENGKPREKWYRLDLGLMSDTLYDNPNYSPESEPVFAVTNQVDHNLGFVQGEWLRTSEDKHSPDGDSLIGDILDFIDEINYSLSQSSQAVGYGQEPQLVLKGMTEDEMQALIKSSLKAWTLGKDGEASFLESSLGGVERAIELRDKVRLGIQDIARVVMMDPEKMIGQAQSGKAMEILHGPLVELINELRPHLEEKIINLVLKIALTILILNDQGVETGIEIPQDFVPKSLAITATWPAVFPMTITDLKDKVLVATTAANASIISRETMTRWLAKDFGVENIEEELNKITAQPVLNPFGSF